MSGETLVLRDAPWMARSVAIAVPGRTLVPATKRGSEAPAVPGGGNMLSPAASLTGKGLAGQPGAVDLERESVARARQEGIEEGLARAAQSHDTLMDERARSIEMAQRKLQEATDKLQRDQEQFLQHMKAREQEVSRQRAKLERLLKELPEAWTRHLQDSEEDMLALTFETVCRVVGDRVVAEEGVREMLLKTMESWHGRHPLSIHVHPEDLTALQADPELKRVLATSGFAQERQTLRWVPDGTVVLGGCLLRSEEGALDARLEVQLQAIRSTLVQTRDARRQARELHVAVEAAK